MSYYIINGWTNIIPAIENEQFQGIVFHKIQLATGHCFMFEQSYK